MSAITVIARATAKPGHEEDLERALRESIPPSHDEPGCLRFSLHRSAQDPSVLVADVQLLELLLEGDPAKSL